MIQLNLHGAIGNRDRFLGADHTFLAQTVDEAFNQKQRSLAMRIACCGHWLAIDVLGHWCRLSRGESIELPAADACETMPTMGWRYSMQRPSTTTYNNNRQ
ncbi:hypothetical protein ACPVPU_09905 [Sphingomonas sp. CJ99]